MKKIIIFSILALFLLAGGVANASNDKCKFNKIVVTQCHDVAKDRPNISCSIISRATIQTMEEVVGNRMEDALKEYVQNLCITTCSAVRMGLTEDQYKKSLKKFKC